MASYKAVYGTGRYGDSYYGDVFQELVEFALYIDRLREFTLER